MKIGFLALVLLLNIDLFSQSSLEYSCSPIDGTPIFLTAVASSEPMDYLGQSFYIYKYDLLIGAAKYYSFYTYKFNKRLYLLDEDVKTLNYTKDQILFDLSEEDRVLDKVYGVFNELDLKLDEKLKLNDKQFYFYSSNSITFAYFNVTRMIFDEELDINQMEIKSYLGTSQCVLKNIVIHPFEKPTGIISSKKKKESTKIKDVKFQRNWDKN